MRNPEYSTVNPQNGNVAFRGPLEDMRGDHSHMPQRTDAYLDGDERGHVNASSLGGVNTPSNVVAQHHDVNHRSFYSVENGERTALRNGATIESEKTAIVDDQPGSRPHTFTINDSVTYADGHRESIHHSFTNEAYALQSEWNEMSAALPGTFDAPNPDGLRDTMTTEQYSSLMQETDAQLPGLADEYAPSDFSGAPTTADAAADSSADTEASADDGSADAGADSGASADPD